MGGKSPLCVNWLVHRINRQEIEAAARTSDAGALFGAAIGMREVFENLLNLFSVEMRGVNIRTHPALSMEDSIAAAAAMCSSNPARLLSIEDRGALVERARGDIVLLEISGEPGSFEVRVRETISAGHVSGT